MLSCDLENGTLVELETGLVYADRRWDIRAAGARQGGSPVGAVGLSNPRLETRGDEVVLLGMFEELGLELERRVRPVGQGLEEILRLRNLSGGRVRLDNLSAGFRAGLADRPAWRLAAIPFRVQLDGSKHDYSGQDLAAGRYANAVFRDETQKYLPPLAEEGLLRSEAWAWGMGDRGIVVIKYNNRDIELSVARKALDGDSPCLEFGGAGFCLYGEPSAAHDLEPGAEFTFGSTLYFPYQGGLNQAFLIYRSFLEEKGHTFSPDYNPPVNWNELYDIGWHHSKAGDLARSYTRQALLAEAAKARDIGCELLYLDPGWEVCEGTTLWDEARLGKPADLARILREEYGLGLGYRTILRTYQDRWPAQFWVKHHQDSYEPVKFGEQYFWEVCACNPVFWEEKLRRILEISRQGVRFMMVDEFDWRGPCDDPAHNHPLPTSPLDHVKAVYALCKAIRAACPGLQIEAHDPVWPWATSIYVPTYFQQGFGEKGCYDENWGFEYMWDCLNDLKSGRALALYYYNLACSIPLYLHITMAADNDACVFFWWVASTVRHLGIGGKTSHPTIEPPQGLPERDPEKRFAAYKAQMALYQELKPYFTRGKFWGIAENAHLHTLAGHAGGVLNLFNLTDDEMEIDLLIPAELLGSTQPLAVSGAEANWSSSGVRIRARLQPMSPALVRIGEAAA